MAERKQGYPLGSFRFRLSIPGVEDSFAAFSYCSGFSYNQKVAGIRFGDDPPMVGHGVFYGGDYSEITFRRGVIENTDLFNYVFRAQNDFKRPDGNKVLKDGTDLILTVYKDDGTPGARWTFHQATLSGYRLGEMNASDSGILLETFTFKFFMGVDMEIPKDNEKGLP